MRRVGLGPGGIRTLFALGVLAGLRGLALVMVAESITRGVVSVTTGTSDWRSAVLLGCAGAILRALTTWASQVVAARAGAAATERVRAQLASRLVSGAPMHVGAATALGTVGLDELDRYYRSVLPSVMSAAVIPLIVGARILSVDWVSALIVVLTLPLIPVFMALVGLHSRDQADAASASLERLSNHLVELARGLPVLVGLGRLDDQSTALKRVSADHRQTTMATLRSAFLSSLVLELIATISVAVVAVFVGVRLVGGDLTLSIGLLALILAPECFAPFREVGAAFHAAQDGMSSLRRARAVIDEPRIPAAVRASSLVGVRGLVVHHPGRQDPTVDGLDIDLPHGSITALVGASGSGKSTVLGVLAGTIAPTRGRREGFDAARVAWVPQHPRTVADTVRGELELYADGPSGTARAQVDPLLRRLGLSAVADDDPARLSPGELRRLAVARGLLRVAAGAELLLLDEPTAHLDSAHARIVEREIEALRGRVTVVIASHEEGATRLADHRIVVGAEGGARAAQPAGDVDERPSVAPAATSLGANSAARELIAFLRPTAGRAVAAILLGTAASLFAISLTALSGWLVVRASEQPPIMYLLVAIVGVRFLGLGRAVLRYAERLLTHDAVLGSVVDLRARLWRGLGARGVGSRSLATGAVALDYLVAAADRVRDLVPRVLPPVLVALLVSAGAAIAVASLHPAALPVLAWDLAASLVLAPAVAVVADRASGRRLAASRSALLRGFSRTVAAADDVRANGVSSAALARLAELDHASGRDLRASAWALGLGQAIVALAGSIAAVSMVAVPQPPAGAVLAVVVLLPIAMIEPLAGLVDAVQQWPALRSALHRVREVTRAIPRVAPIEAAPPPATDRVEELTLDGLSARWPGATGVAFGPVSASARRGGWMVVEGPSGSGKSTLIATLLGFLPPASGRWSLDGRDATRLDPDHARLPIAWCPQEGHLFDSTIRGNLRLAGPVSDDEMWQVVRAVGLGSLLDSLPDGLDTPVGPGGSTLSGGERQRLAVARTLLTDADIVLLDEPTAHLDADGATALISDLRRALADRIVVLVSHHADEVQAGDALVKLGGGDQTATAMLPTIPSPGARSSIR